MSPLTTFILLLASISIAAGACSKGQYWNSTQGRCVACTKCRHRQVIIHKCSINTDTVCSPRRHKHKQQHRRIESDGWEERLGMTPTSAPSGRLLQEKQAVKDAEFILAVKEGNETLVKSFTAGESFIVNWQLMVIVVSLVTVSLMIIVLLYLTMKSVYNSRTGKQLWIIPERSPDAEHLLKNAAYTPVNQIYRDTTISDARELETFKDGRRM